MSADDNHNSTSNYAPKSPDLSSLYPAGPTQNASQLHLTPHPHPQPPPPPASASPSAQNPPIDFSHSPRHASSSSSSYPPPVATAGPHDVADPGYPGYSPSAQQHYLPPSPQQNVSPSQAVPYGQQPPALLHHPQPAYFQAQAFPGQVQQQHLGVQLPQYYLRQPVPTSPSASAQPPPPLEMPPRRAAAGPPPPAIEPSPVRTKFPTARIKRIMQADEEVGKVAQQTPIAVGKALELFMVQLVSKSAEVAKDKGSKRVTAPMLKQVVETDDQWDFLRDIVSRVENEKEGSRAKAKAESESEEEEPEPKKRGRGAGRRKKAA
ncbi:histone-like transcription factor (CBF/NF-Y) and archaeal histone domain-containing protein [Hirsutella rhossiliensis]|uniref:NCT transcriptional regulatory complex subunit A n=1 Tax=Hirsutella rhossiliensis TaxID=111463 RepID=A0A9P8SJB9_9HYPO|nr:histone-like transcription factor (CBF/NF-Y) and archaeal histone domain-containing protein [Hirsutella rhossiliensis]KAH0963545.1 histone-like transcription factor (CBF/NF-Y) and archaeal histone domain-containing protein [Hirsutella rhossiliensis]